MMSAWAKNKEHNIVMRQRPRPADQRIRLFKFKDETRDPNCSWLAGLKETFLRSSTCLTANRNCMKTTANSPSARRANCPSPSNGPTRTVRCTLSDLSLLTLHTVFGSVP